jgi:hypothetical protein
MNEFTIVVGVAAFVTGLLIGGKIINVDIRRRIDSVVDDIADAVKGKK